MDYPQINNHVLSRPIFSKHSLVSRFCHFVIAQAFYQHENIRVLEYTHKTWRVGYL